MLSSYRPERRFNRYRERPCRRAAAAFLPPRRVPLPIGRVGRQRTLSSRPVLGDSRKFQTCSVSSGSTDESLLDVAQNPFAGVRAGPPPCLRGPKPPIRRAGAPGRIPARCPATAQTWAAVMPPGYAPSRPPSDWTRSTRAGFARTGCCRCSPCQHTHVQPVRQCSFPRPAQINSPA